MPRAAWNSSGTRGVRSGNLLTPSSPSYHDVSARPGLTSRGYGFACVVQNSREGGVVDRIYIIYVVPRGFFIIFYHKRCKAPKKCFDNKRSASPRFIKCKVLAPDLLIPPRLPAFRLAHLSFLKSFPTWWALTLWKLNLGFTYVFFTRIQPLLYRKYYQKSPPKPSIRCCSPTMRNIFSSQVSIFYHLCLYESADGSEH